MTVFKVAQADWNETSPDSPAYIKNKPSSIGEGGTSEIPHFDLAALGLADPDDTPSGYSYISADTNELIAALSKGPVKLSILITGKVEEHIVTGSYRPTNDPLQIPWQIQLTPHKKARTYTYAIFDDAILCVSGRNKVPGVTFTDDGKVLAIDDGEWVLQDPVVGSLKADILPKTKMTLSSVIQPFGVFGATETGWFKLKEGETYNVEWDTLASVQAYKAFTYSYDEYEAVVLGNRSYLQGETDIVQDPFIIYYIPANNYCVVMSTEDTSAQEHTFRVYQDNLQKLDEKYLSIIDNPNSLEELFSEVLLFEYNNYFSTYCHTINYALFNIVDQQSYTIEWGDKQYQRTSFAFTAADGASCVGIGNTLVNGGENNGDEFAIVHDYTNNLLHFLSLDEDAYHKIKVYKNVQATIKSEYLPSMSLPIVTEADNGKVLSVKDGEWTVSEGLSLQETLLENTFYFSESDQSGLYAEIGELLYPDTLFLSKNEVYQVVWDGVEYSCVSSLQSFGVATGIAIGNLGLLGLGELTDEPFIIGATSDGLAMCYTSSTEETHTIRIYQETKPSMSWNDLTDKPLGENADGTVKQIDNKYLAPIKTVSGYAELWQEVEFPTFLNSDYGVYFNGITVDQATFDRWHANTDTVRVTYDGTSYECEPQTVGGYYGVGNGVPFGGTGNNEPFVITVVLDNGRYYLTCFCLTDTASTQHTLKVELNELQYKLREEYLPMDAIKAYIDEYISKALSDKY